MDGYFDPHELALEISWVDGQPQWHPDHLNSSRSFTAEDLRRIAAWLEERASCVPTDSGHLDADARSKSAGPSDIPVSDTETGLPQNIPSPAMRSVENVKTLDGGRIAK